MSALKAGLILPVLAFLAAGNASAQTWTGLGGNPNWSTPANWNPVGVPPSGANLSFPASTSTMDASFVIGRLTSTGTGTTAIGVTGGSSLTINAGITQGVSSVALNISAPIIIGNSSELWSFPGASNTFSGPISGNSFIKTGAGSLLLNGNNTFGSVTVTVGTLILNGSNAFSSANLAAGTLQANTSSALGSAAITVTGGTLRLANSSSVVSTASIGVFADATLVVQGGGAHSVDTLDIGNGTTLTVTNLNGSTLSVPGTLTGIGLNGSGTLNGAVMIPAGGNLTPGDPDGTGTLTVTTLGLNASSNLNYAVGTSATSLVIGTPLTVTGVVNIIDNGLVEGGPYVLIQGSTTAPLTAGALSLGTVPSGFSYNLSLTGNQLLLTVGPAPTAVAIASQDAVSDGHASYLTWTTGSELRNLGYHVYRQDGANRTLLTPGLIAGSRLRAAADLKVGRSYTWIDRSSPAGGTYWIESIDMNGKTKMFGPWTTRPGSAPTSRASPLFSKTSNPSTVVAVRNPQIASTPNPDSEPIPGDQSQQWANAAGPAARISVRDSGVYRVPAEQLFGAGIPAGSMVSGIQISASGIPVSFRPIVADGLHLNAGDAIEFYGHGIDTKFSDTRHYWVTLGSGSPALLTPQTASAPGDAGTSFAETLNIHERLYYFSGLKNGSAEKFFGPQVPSTGLTRIFSTPALDLLSSSSSTLEVAVQCLTPGPHSISVRLNGVVLGTMSGVNTTLLVKVFSVPTGLLLTGDNNVVLTAQSGAEVDVESYQRLTYPRRFVGLGAPLRFTAPGGTAVHLDDFDLETTRVFDITNPELVHELHLVADPANQSGSVLNVPSSSDVRTLYAFRPSDEVAPLDVQYNAGSQWHAFAGAQLVIIAHSSLLESVQPLVQQRQNEGLTVAVIDVQDIYNEFSFGEKDAGAIRDFLQYASRNWALAPRYVLLVGGATYDPRDYLNNPGLDLVPTNLIETVFLETASDGAFVDFSSAGGTNIAIGRWPVTSPADAALVVDKTLKRVPLTSRSSILLVHDSDGTTSFSKASAKVAAAVSPWSTKEIARGSGPDATIHDAVIAAMRSGPAALDYQGHGAEDFWDGNILSDGDSAALADAGQSMLFSAATCFNGYFVDIGRASLAQTLLLTEGGGAWAAWASSGMTSPTEHSQLSSDLLESAVVDGLTLGEASLRAKSTITDPDIRSTFHLFGDPSARMAPGRSTSFTAPTSVQSHVATGCSTPGDLALALLPLIALALLTNARIRRPRVTTPVRRD